MYTAVGDDIMSPYVMHLCDIVSCCISLKSYGHYLLYKFCFFLQMYWRLPVNAYVALYPPVPLAPDVAPELVTCTE
ncbi:Mitochondrial Rho GTPase [Corchorus olitorius]|uniref:Mitochondrial Rho GTPase n=1 Tax=Corchorus olitorius TaxID=93759 RepID=A0A1R3KTI6_9ROSI|nr:Mitochondrial Rho GTPase [Corchorus olitorius]